MLRDGRKLMREVNPVVMLFKGEYTRGVCKIYFISIASTNARDTRQVGMFTMHATCPRVF